MSEISQMREEIHRLRRVNAEIVVACKAMLEFFEHAPFDLRNGVEYMGVDEGEVRGWPAIRELETQARAAIAKAEAE